MNDDSMMFMYEDGDGGMAVVDDAQLQADAQHLAAMMLTHENLSGDSAAKALLKMNVDKVAPEYQRLVVQRAASIVTLYAVEEAKPFHHSIIFSNLRDLIMAYRIVRPTPPAAPKD